MPRPKKESEFLSCRIDRQVFKKLEELCNESGLSKTKAVEKALEKYYNEFKKTGQV